MARVRPALEPPSCEALKTDHRIEFRHPAYPTENALLSLAAFDGENKDGIDYDVACWACGIVANNSWASGWLATKQGDEYQRVNKPENGILRQREYYYFTGDHPASYRYPVIPSFDHWRFPHDNLPDLWKDATISRPPPFSAVSNNRDAIVFRDVSCRISGHSRATEVAHLVPVADGHWLTYNRMNKYCCDEPVNDQANMILLRKDLHHLFDQRRFAFIPRGNPDEQNPPFLIHVFTSPQSTELVELYHNRLLQPIAGVSKELVFARFAQAVFDVENYRFLKGMARFACLLFDVKTGKSSVRDLTANQVRDNANVFTSFTQSRSNSPRKRERRSDSVANEGEYNWDGDGELDDDPPRGRRRKRSFDWFQHGSPPGLEDSFASTKSVSVSSVSASPDRDLALKAGSKLIKLDYCVVDGGEQGIYEDDRPLKMTRLE
ncbi:uncharacterized protein FMAN_14327 [Fusarium mangiferae]|uniref:HNH nuclease domain-containing protein n=1 Tax=Fusarium mangiferae TaxID=192010 RepID=A0A1L7UF03_FUSMA|nr:uncharacterized protein FMAN_14327 [Fusarium mangiferae]CVL09234.1 uncharacterized protein FMAN_14327 [Fusarium mangiferae]